MHGGDPTQVNGRSFTIGDSDFLLDGEPFRVLSGVSPGGTEDLPPPPPGDLTQ